MTRRRTRGAEDAGSLGDVRPQDIVTFMEIYERCEKLSEDQRKTHAGLFGIGAKHPGRHLTTVSDQLLRLAALVGRNAPGVRAGGEAGLDVLFAKGVKDKGYWPTEYATALFEELKVVRDAYERAGDRVRKRLGGMEGEKVVSVGAGRNFGLQLMAYILGRWKELFEDVRLTVAIRSTGELLELLAGSHLDAVIAYRSRDSVGKEVKEPPGVAFTSFGYDSKFVLICHPTMELRVKGSKKDANAGYWEELRHAREQKKTGRLPPLPAADVGAREHEPRHASLRPISLEDLDYGSTELIVARSFDQSPKLLEAAAAAEAADACRLVNGYDECLALVLMGQGVAVVPEVFCKERGVTAFRVEPEALFTRSLGAYYNNKRAMQKETMGALMLIQRFLTTFATSVRNGRPWEVVEGESFGNWCQAVKQEYSRLVNDGAKWRAEVERQYPGCGSGG